MNITEIGYYETRDGGLAYVVGICSPDILEGEFKEFRVFGALVPSTEEREHGAHWKINGARRFAGDWGDDLIRYIGKELPEEKPQPERVELSKLWVIWWKPNDRLCPYSFWKGDVLFNTKEKAKEYFPDTLLSYQKIAITPADATGFTPGENL